MPLTPSQLLELEIESAWDVFRDSDPEGHADVLKILDPKCYEMMRLAFAHGYSDGAQSVYRSLQK